MIKKEPSVLERANSITSDSLSKVDPIADTNEPTDVTNKKTNSNLSKVDHNEKTNNTASKNRSKRSVKNKKPKTVVAINKSKTLIAHDWWATNTPRLAPARSDNNVEFFICGENYFKKLAVDLENAKHEILITDWVLNPEINLLRSKKLEPKNTLIEILKRAGQRGVIVRVMLYDSVDSKAALDLDDIATERKLEGAHKNIRVHRYRHKLKFSPHQKTVVIDSHISYIGGIDLAFGRWDNAEHKLFADPTIFPNETYNPRLGVTFNVNTQPRMPWQDVHARIEGPSTVDIQTNFTQRWAFMRTSGYNDPVLTIPERKITGNGNHRVQIIRSIDSNSISQAGTERSIEEVYIKAINGAKHFIYIENQFFISNFGTSKVRNEIANAIANRIILAIERSEVFRVYVVIPLHPEGPYPDASTNELLHWQFQTILRAGKNSLIGQIREKLKKDDVSNYINFFCLRNYGKLKSYVTEQIYVHTKLLIVDDRVTILGSANINDRSLIGSRDNEINAVFLDKSTKKIKINNIDSLVRTSSHNLRCKLWEQHLGSDSIGKVTDPCSQNTLDIFLKVAKKNTATYEKIFPNIPRNSFRTYDPLLAAPDLIKNMKEEDMGKYLKNNIQGHLTIYPLDWLADQDLESFTIPDDVMTYNNNFGDSNETA